MGFINQSTSLAGTTGISPFYVVESQLFVVTSYSFVVNSYVFLLKHTKKCNQATSLGVTPLQRWYWSKKPLMVQHPQVSEYHQGHRLMGPARGAFSPGAMWASSGWGFNGWTIKKAEFLMGYLVEYYEHFMGEQPSQPDFCPSWVTWKCWESGENPMLSTGKSGFPLFLGIIPNFYTHVYYLGWL